MTRGERGRYDAAPEPFDTHDTGRDHLTAARRNRTRPSATPASKRAETGPASPTTTNGQRSDTIMTPTSTPTPPEGYTAVTGDHLRAHMAAQVQERIGIADGHAAPIYWVSAPFRLPGLPAVEIVWTPELGRLARNRLTGELLVRPHATMQGLLDAFSYLATYEAGTERPDDWTAAPIGIAASLAAHPPHPAYWRGPTTRVPGLPTLQLRWDPETGVSLARTDTGGTMTRGDLAGALAGLRDVIRELQGGGQA